MSKIQLISKEIFFPRLSFFFTHIMSTSITIPSACDFHIHLRQGDMMRMVTPKVEEGGVSLAYVMVDLYTILQIQCIFDT
jgi:hypothetical protein